MPNSNLLFLSFRRVHSVSVSLMAANEENHFDELSDVHYVYGLEDGNSHLAQRVYQERFSMRLIPHYQFFRAFTHS